MKITAATGDTLWSHGKALPEEMKTTHCNNNVYTAVHLTRQNATQTEQKKNKRPNIRHISTHTHNFPLILCCYVGCLHLCWARELQHSNGFFADMIEGSAREKSDSH